MREKVSDEMINKLAMLSGLELTDKEKDIIKNDMEDMIEYIQILKKIDTSEIDIYKTVEKIENNNIKKSKLDKYDDYNNQNLHNMYREDKVINNDGDLLENMSNKEGRYIVVPKTI